MKRELKFRAWDTILNRMYPAFEMKEYMSMNEMGQDNIVPQTANEIELMQFTGLKDKNGKEIYEGDFLKDEYNRILLVEWWQYAFTLKAITKTNFVRANYIIQWFLGVPFLPEIIGNIYENPELLEPKIEE